MQDLKLVFVVAYKSVLNLEYVPKLLEKVRMIMACCLEWVWNVKANFCESRSRKNSATDIA